MAMDATTLETPGRLARRSWALNGFPGLSRYRIDRADPAEQQDAGVGHRTHFAGDGECADVDRVRLAEKQGADAQKEQAKRGSTRKKHFHRTSYTVRASALFLDDS